MASRELSKKIIQNESIDRDSGRVVDLKNINIDSEIQEFFQTNTTPKRRRLFSKKEKDINLLGKYKVEENDFDEEALFSEFEKDDKRRFLPFEMLLRTLRIWWIPVFIIKFVFILVWRSLLLLIFRRRIWDDKVKIIKDEVLNHKIEIRKKKEKPKESKEPVNFKKFIINVKEFFIGRSTHDYLYQQALFEEIVKKKFNPVTHFITFVLLAAVLTVPFKVFSEGSLIDIGGLKGRVLGVSEEAIDNLSQAASSISNLKLGEASYEFFLARDNFKQARESLNEINGVLFTLAKFIPDEKIKMATEGKHILLAGELASNLGRNLTLAFESFTKNDKVNCEASESALGCNKKISEMIDEFIIYETGALEDARKLREELYKIDKNNLVEKYRDNFILITEKTDELVGILEEVNDVIKKVNIFLGKEADKRYLFVFQNNNEARATGGFIGSFALVDFSQGKVKNIEVPEGGSYDTENGLERFITAPEPLYLVNPLWHFWDANWWPDWKKSAKKLMWFYEKSGGPSVDGVISFTPTVLEKFLEVIGPVDMTQDYGVIMNADNFWENIREIVKKENDKSGLTYEEMGKRPKKVIGDLLAIILKELPNRLDKDSFIDLLAGLEESLDEKQALFYFTDDNLQELVEKRNWAGRIKDTSKDYLAVINTNIAGGKSDKKIREEIIHEAEVMPDGSIINSLTITREHTGKNLEPYYGMRNVNWMRIYVPEGSKLIHASGFRGPDPIYFEYPEEGWEKDVDVVSEEDGAQIDKNNVNTKIYNENGKTVFANWSMVDPGHKAVIKLKYELPFKLQKPKQEIEEEGIIKEMINKIFNIEKKELFVYSFLFQKQAGSRFTNFQTNLDLGDNFNSVWNYPKDLEISEKGWNVSGDLDIDKYWAVILEQKNKE